MTARKQIAPHDGILDDGCGTDDIVDHLPAVDDEGFGPSQRYIDDATARTSQQLRD